MKITTWLKQNNERLIEMRRHLHQHPEIGFEECKTKKYLQDILSNNGYDILQDEKMKTGFITQYGSGRKPIIALRCELDAVPLFDAKTVPYRSKIDGFMHSCGHDVHMTILTGLALFLKESNFKIPGTIRFIYQPAEEKAPGGALTMIKAGALKNVNHLIGAHVQPKLKVGKVGVNQGPVSALVDVLDITLQGEGGHTSRPHETTDLIPIMAQLVIALDEAIMHKIDTQNPVVLCFGAVRGGATFNVIPGKLNLLGTLRYLDFDLKEKLHKLIGEVIHNTSMSTGAKIDWYIPYSAPGINNDEQLTKLISQSASAAIGSKNVVSFDKASMGGEDFGFYLEKVPGTYFRVGSDDGYSTDLHSIKFDVNEKCIAVAIKVLFRTLKDYCKHIRM